jgi:hypothetical protein
VRRLPVVDASERLAEVIALADLARHPGCRLRGTALRRAHALGLRANGSQEDLGIAAWRAMRRG